MNLRSKLAAVIGAVSGVAAVPAMAEVPAGAQAVFTQAAADFTVHGQLHRGRLIWNLN